MAVRLTSRRVEKPWGRRDLPAPFSDPADRGRSIGEIIFDSVGAEQAELLVKFLFTSEKLSIQVHPDDRSAQRDGLPRGKDEAWIVLGAEPEATIGLGLIEPLDKQALRASAVDGSIERLVDWRPVEAGEAYYSPAGTIHAIGPGLSLLEIQQNNDVTYRLYDYARPRELHLDQAVGAARTELAPDAETPIEIAPGRVRVAGGPAFQVEQLMGGRTGRLTPPAHGLWLIALAGEGTLDGVRVKAGEAWLPSAGGQLDLAAGARFIIAYPGAETLPVWKAQ